MASKTPPVALITGASSGIGLALTQHLLSLHWHVALLDINPPPIPLDPSSILFIPTDVSSWDALASAFSKTFSWHNRLDFCALNAGIDDRDDIFASITPDVPTKPSMRTFEVDLFAVYYGIKLGAHYMSKNSGSVGSGPGGKITITASSAGLYALPLIPQYTAAKHALVGLTRALAPVAEVHDIRINAICPAVVATGLAPPGLLDAFSEEQMTPMSTIIRAFEELGEFGKVGGREDWVKSGHNGQIVEASLGNLYYRSEVEKSDKGQDYMTEGALDAWAKAYRERNRGFALGEGRKVAI